MDELDRLRQAHDAVRTPEAPAVDAARRRLRDTINEATSAAPPARGSGPQRRGLRVAVVAGMAGVAFLVAIALWPGNGSNPAGPSAASAARLCVSSGPGPAGPCLDALGALAAADDVLQRGKVFYRRDLWSQSIMYIGRDGRPQVSPHGSGVFGIVRAGDQELWVAPDRSGRMQFGPPQRPYLPSEADRRAWRAAGSPDLDRLAGATDPRDDLPPRSFKAGELDAILLGDGSLDEALPNGDPLRELPAEPQALARAVRRIGWYQRVRISGEEPCAPDLHDCSIATRRSIDARYGTNITTLLRYPFASPQLRRTLLHLLGAIPGARRLGGLRDPEGRRGAAILIPGDLNDGRNVILFDLATGRLLADGRANDATAATLRWQNVYDLKVGAVDRIGRRPA